jgi:hypothetical protein
MTSQIDLSHGLQIPHYEVWWVPLWLVEAA